MFDTSRFDEVARTREERCMGAPDPSPTCNGHVRRWWKEAVVYQVWPRSFRDSNGDGIGDLPGLLQRLDHLSDLGVDTVWLSPHYDSPNVDNGYDVRDYRKVDPAFGTLADFDALVRGLHARSMRLIVDLVVNHTSNQHAWFRRSRRSRHDPYRRYYHWHPGRDGGPPNDWRSFFSGSAWTRDPATGEFYLHLFASEQPDLNWDEPRVRREVHDVMRFWLDRGVAGFRMDVIPFVAKDPSLADYPPEQRSRPEFHHAAGPRLLEYLQEMRREVLEPYRAVAIGEAFGVTHDRAKALVDPANAALEMLIHFDAIRLDRGAGWRWRPWTLPELKATLRREDAALDRPGWRTLCLSNHDNPRLVSHFGDDDPRFRVASATLLATLLLTLRGTPFVYQGDEIGLTNLRFTGADDLDDVEARNAWRDEVASGRVDPATFLWHLNRTGRDHARAPIPWDSGPGAGFTTGTPWYPLPPDAGTINVRRDRAADASVFRHYARLIGLRRSTPALVYGDTVDLAPEHATLYAYTRAAGDEAYLVALNVSRQPLRWRLPDGVRIAAAVLGNLDHPTAASDELCLRPWEAVVFRLTVGAPTAQVTASGQTGRR